MNMETRMKSSASLMKIDPDAELASRESRAVSGFSALSLLLPISPPAVSTAWPAIRSTPGSALPAAS